MVVRQSTYNKLLLEKKELELVVQSLEREITRLEDSLKHERDARESDLRRFETNMAAASSNQGDKALSERLQELVAFAQEPSEEEQKQWKEIAKKNEDIWKGFHEAFEAPQLFIEDKPVDEKVTVMDGTQSVADSKE